MNRPVCVSMASWPGLRHEEVAQRLAAEVREPLFGSLKLDHVQLVPQCFGLLDEAVIDGLMQALPNSRLRLHASVRVQRTGEVVDLIAFDDRRAWFDQAARLSRRLRAPAYSAHPGRREQGTLHDLVDHARRCADLFDCPVAIEGQYPTRAGAGRELLVSNWADYRFLFDSGVPYALDLSHVNILAQRTGAVELGLLSEMLGCERCLEVHVSDNDGSRDEHRICESWPWWYSLLLEAHSQAVIFSEGVQRRRPASTASAP